MSFSFNSVIRAAAVRVNAVTGATSSALESSYTTSPLTTTQIDSADFTLAVFKDTALIIQGKLAHAIANVGNHPWRAYLASVTASLAHGAFLPSLDGANPIVGVWGAVRDASDSTVCTEMSEDDIRIAKRNANSWLVTPVYGYKMDGHRIFHTRTNVIIDCCIYNGGTHRSQLDSIGLGYASVLPDALEEAMVCGMVSMLVRDDAFMPQAQVYRAYFDQTLQMIDKGLTSVPPKAIPGPTLIAA